jgi:hypothetical protein
MSQFPEDDKPIADFLRQYRPTMPSADFNLEEQIMATIATESHPPNRFRPRQSQVMWLMPPAIAASLVAGFLGHRMLTPTVPATEVATLEAFLEETWQDTAPQSDENWLPRSLPVSN